MIQAMLGVALAAPPTADLDARPSVVVVHQGSATCAGVLLDDGAIATAYHCVAGGFGARVERRDRPAVRARVVATDPGHDLALLAPRDPIGAGLSLGEAPEVGDAVTIVGHPYAGAPPGGFLEGTLRWSVSSGRVAAVGTRSLQLDATVAPGNSGGPVLDAEGRVVGIVSRRLGGGIGFAGRSEALAALRDAPRRPALGGTVALSPVGWTGGRPTVGLELEATWRERVVLAVRSGVPIAPRARAMEGDEVEAVLILGRAGLRQPIGHGGGSLSVEAFAALGATRSWTQTEDGGLRVESGLAPYLGGAIGRGGIALEASRRLGPASTGTTGDWLLGLRLGLGLTRRVW